MIAQKCRAIGARSLRNGQVQKPPTLVRSVLNEAKFPRRKKDAVHIAEQIDGARDLISVDAQFPFIVVNVRFEQNVSVTVFRFRTDISIFRSRFDELAVVANAQRSARAKIKYGFRAVGFPLRVFAEQHVNPFGKGERFVLVISKIV